MIGDWPIFLFGVVITLLVAVGVVLAISEFRRAHHATQKRARPPL